MSRIGKKSILIPVGVTVTVTDGTVSMQGPKGELKLKTHRDIKVETREGTIVVSPWRHTRQSNALWGLTGALMENMVAGVMKGFEKKLVFEGVGYRANLEGKNLLLQLGFSHPVRFNAPEGITLSIEKNIITVSGINKELVGNVAAGIRLLKPPEPYKGKGIRYQDEVIKRKVGKKAVASA